MSVGYDEALFVLGGDPDAIVTSGARWSAFSDAADTAAQDLGHLDTAEFTGDEADLFRQSIDGHLASRLRTSGQAWHIVATALTRFGATLADCQQRLRPLRLHAQMADSDGDVTSLSKLQDAARTVQAEHEHAMATCTADIRRAAGMRFAEPPGWFAGLLDGVCDFIADHVPVLKTISSALKQISSIAGMLAMIPALAPIMAPIAVVAGGAAVAVDGVVLAATGQGSLIDLALDGAAMIPGARAAVAVGVAGTAQAADRAAHGDGSWTDVLVTAASVAIGGKAGHHHEPTHRPRRGDGDAAQYRDEASSPGTESAPAPGQSGDRTSPTEGTAHGRGPDNVPAAPEELPVGLPPGTEHLYRAGAAKVPREWGPPIPNKKSSRGKPGLRWFGPNPNADGVRIDLADPNSPNPSQRVDHVIVRWNHDPLLPDGSAAVDGIKENWECHLPLSDWIQWKEWNKP